MIETKEFSNGFKVTILNKKDDTIKFSLNIGAGFKHEDLGNNGISHYLEHVLILKRLQIIYPYLIDFTTTYNSINLFFQCKKKNLQDLIRDLFDLFTYDNFDKEHIKFIEEEKTIVKNDINLYHDQICSSSQWIFLNRKLFPNSSKGLNYLGNKKNVEQISSEKLLEWKNKYFVSNNTNLNFVGDINFKFIENILKNNFLSLKKSKLNLELLNISNEIKPIIKESLKGKYFYYAFDLNSTSIKLQLTALCLMNEISSAIKEIVRNQKRDGYFNFSEMNWDLGYLYTHLGSFNMPNEELVEIITDYLQMNNFDIDKDKFTQLKGSLKGYLNYLPENLLLVNMANVSFDNNSLNIFDLQNKIDEFTYKDFKNNLAKFFNLKQDYVIIE